MLGLLQPNFGRMFFLRQSILPENLRSVGQAFFELFNLQSSCWMKTTQKPSSTSWIIARNSHGTGVNSFVWNHLFAYFIAEKQKHNLHVC